MILLIELMRSGTFWLRHRTPSGSGKYIRFELRIETGAERTTIVDILDMIQQVRGKRVELGPSLTTCQGYDAQMLLIRRLTGN